ncbi:MAG: hypothetical protein ACI4NO_01810 [Oxalobacter sp.]
MSQQSESVEALVWQAASGDIEARYVLGVALLNGEGVDVNREKGIEWLTAAASAGHVGAIEQLKLLG